MQKKLSRDQKFVKVTCRGGYIVFVSNWLFSKKKSGSRNT